MEVLISRAPKAKNTIKESLDLFRTFPYKKEPYCKRNWGHPLHSVCSYPSKLKPGLANCLIELFTSKNDTVLDPFCGIGTVPFEASLLGRKSIGIDLNPLAYFATKAKVNSLSVYEINSKIEEISRAIKRRKKLDIGWVEPEIKSFFHEETLKEIIIARQILVGKMEFDPVDAFLITIISHILHGNRPYALSRRSHNIIPIPPKGEFVYKPLIKSLREKADRMIIKPLPKSFVPGRACQADVLNMPLGDKGVDIIITSPPFLGTTEFLRQNRVRIWFCGWSYKEQNRQKNRFFEYFKDLNVYDRVLKEFRRVLRPNGLIIFHLGIYKNHNMGEEIKEIAISNDFELLDLILEDASALENHGRVQRGGTHTHQFLFLTA